MPHLDQRILFSHTCPAANGCDITVLATGGDNSKTEKSKVDSRVWVLDPARNKNDPLFHRKATAMSFLPRIQTLTASLLVLLTFSMISNAVDSESDTLLANFKVSVEKFNAYTTRHKSAIDPSLVDPDIAGLVSFSLKSKTQLTAPSSVISRAMEIGASDSYFLLQISRELLKQSENISIDKQNEVVVFLLSNQILNNPSSSIGFYQFISRFDLQKYYNQEAKTLILARLASQDEPGYYLYLLLASGLIDDPSVLATLSKFSSSCRAWNENASWLSLVLLAQKGDKNALKKILSIAEIKSEDNRRRQIQFMPLQLSLIRDRKVVSVLSNFLASDEKYLFSAPIFDSLSEYAAMALGSMIIGFPEINGTYNDAKKAECIKWLEQNKEYIFKPKGDISLPVRNILWNF